MTVNSVDDIAELNRKQRTRMSTIKEGQKVSRVIIQEGVYTHETWGEAETVAEPVVYMIDHNVVGGFYRVHEARAANENLNAPGMRFEPLAFDDCCISPERELDADAHQNRLLLWCSRQTCITGCGKGDRGTIIVASAPLQHHLKRSTSHNSLSAFLTLLVCLLLTGSRISIPCKLIQGHPCSSLSSP